MTAYSNPYEAPEFQKGFDPNEGLADFEASWEDEYEEYCTSQEEQDQAKESWEDFREIDDLSYNDYVYGGLEAIEGMRVIFDGDGNARLMPDPDYFSVPVSEG